MSSATANSDQLQRSALRNTAIQTRMGFCLSRFPELRTSTVVDVGCGDGRHLSHFGPGSIGMDGRRLEDADGYRYLQWDFDHDASAVLAGSGVGKQKFVWCSDVFEHHPAPHMFLLDLRRCLQPDGVLFLGVPLVNPIGSIPWFRKSWLLNFFRGFMSQDHINFFSFRGICLTAEFAGFEVLDWYSPFLPIKRPPMVGLEPITTLILRNKAEYQYGPKAYKYIDENGYLRWKTLTEYTTREVPVTR
jgi:SAM-dependent methyltransferase